MIKLGFTEAEQQSLHYERYHHPHPRVQRKMEVLWLKSQGVAHREISRLTGISSTTLTSYLRAYQEGGMEALQTVRFYRPQSELRVHQGTLEGYFQQHPPASAKQAMATIEALTGVRRSPERVRVFLKHLGMKCRKVGLIPAKADVEAQETFKTTDLEPRLEQAKAGQRAVFFYGCRSLRLGAVFRDALVLCPRVYPGASGAPTLQCLGGVERPYPRVDHGGERHLH